MKMRRITWTMFKIAGGVTFVAAIWLVVGDLLPAAPTHVFDLPGHVEVIGLTPDGSCVATARWRQYEYESSSGWFDKDAPRRRSYYPNFGKECYKVGPIEFYSCNSGRPTATIPFPSDQTLGRIRFWLDGSKLVLHNRTTNTLETWSIHDARRVDEVAVGSDVELPDANSADGLLYFAATKDRVTEVVRRDLQLGKSEVLYRFKEGRLFGNAGFSPDLSKLTIDKNRGVLVRDLNTGLETSFLVGGSTDSVWGLNPAVDGALVLAAGSGLDFFFGGPHSVLIYDGRDGRLLGAHHGAIDEEVGSDGETLLVLSRPPPGDLVAEIRNLRTQAVDAISYKWLRPSGADCVSSVRSRYAVVKVAGESPLAARIMSLQRKFPWAANWLSRIPLENNGFVVLDMQGKRWTNGFFSFPAGYFQYSFSQNETTIAAWAACGDADAGQRVWIFSCPTAPSRLLQSAATAVVVCIFACFAWLISLPFRRRRSSLRPA